MMEALLLDLDPTIDPAKVRGLPAGKSRERVLAKAGRWSGQCDQIVAVVHIRETTSSIRNWLVHAWVVVSATGDWVSKRPDPLRGQMRAHRHMSALRRRRCRAGTQCPRHCPGPFRDACLDAGDA
jgi:hypothetical protein